jgi:hypothetical protein
VLERVDGRARGDDLHVGPGPLGEQRRDVRDAADVDRVRAERLQRLRAAADVGPLDVDVELVVEPGELEGGLRGGVAHAQDRAVGHVVRDRRGEREVRARVVGAARGQRERGGEDDQDRAEDRERSAVRLRGMSGVVHVVSLGYWIK